MTSYATPAWPAIMTAFVLELAGRVPPLDPRVRESFPRNQYTVDAARALAEESFVSSITLSRGEEPLLYDPTVLLFSPSAWEESRSSIGVGPPGQRDQLNANWHQAIPTANGEYLLVPEPTLPGALSYYSVTPDTDPPSFTMRTGTVIRGDDGEVVWQRDDDGCHLVRYATGALRCYVNMCDDACDGGVELDPDTGIEYLPCGCPQ
jgi:hypothetical protein